MLRRTSLLVGHVDEIEVDSHKATVTDAGGGGHVLAYRTLVLAPGSVPTVLPIPGLAEHGVGFKTLADAIWLRNRVLSQLEAADATDSVSRRRELLTVPFVGGGYAGVAALAELESFTGDALASHPRLDRTDFRWVLVEARVSLLAGLDARLAKYSERNLRRRGIHVYLDTTLESCVDRRVVLSNPGIPPYRSETIVWAAGQRPSPLVGTLGLPTDRHGRLIVDDHLRVDGRHDVFALGDAAAVPDLDGGMCPPRPSTPSARATCAPVTSPPTTEWARPSRSATATGAWPSPWAGPRERPRSASSPSPVRWPGGWGAPTICS